VNTYRKVLSLKSIRTDGGTQARIRIDEGTSDGYKQLYERGEMKVIGAERPPVVFFDGNEYWLADGFHRNRAAQMAKYRDLEFLVHDGTLRDAIRYAAGANADHGLPRSNADKRLAVLMLLKDQDFRKLSNSQLAEIAKVSPPHVAKVRAEFDRDHPDPTPSRRATADGRVMDISNLNGARPADERSLPSSGSVSAAKRTEDGPFQSFLRSLIAKGEHPDSHVRTKLGISVVVSNRTVYVVQASSGVRAYKEAFFDVFVARQEIDPEYRAVVVGQLTDDIAPLVKAVKRHKVGFRELR
jgi:hypothetical protein